MSNGVSCLKFHWRLLRASRSGNVSCIEALIQASNHETNDDDVDGRTPLLLACLHGHHQAVQVLLSLGGDVTKRSELARNSRNFDVIVFNVTIRLWLHVK